MLLHMFREPSLLSEIVKQYKIQQGFCRERSYSYVNRQILEIAVFGTCNHAVKFFSLFCVRSRDALIGKYGIKLPIAKPNRLALYI